MKQALSWRSPITEHYFMDCPHYQAKNTNKLSAKTALGYLQFCCHDCGSQFNERTGTPYNYIEYPTDVVAMAVYFYYRFKSSLDDVVELMALRNIHLSHQTVYNWAHRFGVELAKQFRKNRIGKSGLKLHMDTTYIRVEGRWCYLYRAIDKQGNLIDVYLSDKRDQTAAENFFLQAEQTSGVTPDIITTDKEPALATATWCADLKIFFRRCAFVQCLKKFGNSFAWIHDVAKTVALLRLEFKVSSMLQKRLHSND